MSSTKSMVVGVKCMTTSEIRLIPTAKDGFTKENDMKLVSTNAKVVFDQVDMTLRFEEGDRVWIVNFEYRENTPVKITHEPPSSYSEDELDYVRRVARNAKGNSSDVLPMISEFNSLIECKGAM